MFDGSTYSSPPLLNKDKVSTECKTFKQGLVKEKGDMVEKGKVSKQPYLQ